MAKSQSYRELLNKSEEQKNSEDREFQIEEAEDQLKADIRETKKAAKIIERRINDLKSKFPLDGPAIIDSQSELDGYKRAIKAMETLKDELFPKTSARPNAE